MLTNVAKTIVAAIVVTVLAYGCSVNPRLEEQQGVISEELESRVGIPTRAQGDADRDHSDVSASLDVGDFEIRHKNLLKGER